MADPIFFPSVTSNLSLPLLIPGQAQKEPFINHALSVVDALFGGVVVDSLNAPPASPQDGSAYRVLENPTGEWSSRDDNIALWIAGAWEFIAPNDGATTFDQTARVQLRFENGWQEASEPAVPDGGVTIDTEARVAISALIEALRTAGVFADSVG